ncbi:SUMF1/EgtB/PvdO family nonheme iron enzyme [Candidatus Sulfurimonas baltica]|uniref:SUMF1/EgtB/PvdO family nonheme iron enzyme n=1 Tax=Candidatus Sulfurimonas baltica TaxID=2740404 RepID=A0A7S7LY55_9BACT|nr:SUMF1/EgtB/PvdO family nonheme iron enzyme [Candidatus Sulfurimonas baltica]QOY53013.1 SUMF1/EgtB/PvdO family nonheme iron enzyme [Candidatus Sulfurimonas baltica]
MKDIIIFLFLLASLTLNASQRVALIIGNNDYKDDNKLFNPVNDAQLLKSTLEKSGFFTIYLENATLKDINSGLDKFKKELSIDSVGLFYFAGHGIQVNGKNYLLPIDLDLQDENEIKYSALEVDKVVRLLKEVKNNTNIIILDACRNNYFEVKNHGLAPFVNPDGLFVAYSTQAGQRALDGDKNTNSPFALALANNINTQDVDIEALFKQVRSDVYTQTNGKQRPSTYSEILEPFYFSTNKSTTRALKKKNLAKANIQTVDFKRHTRYIEPELVMIKADKYVKGNNSDFDTSPAHEMTIEKDFYIGVYEVSFEEYDLFCLDTGWKKPKDDSFGRGKQPVINVSWQDAMEYTRWLSKKSGKLYRLPSESEWEYVARDKQNYNYGTVNDDALLTRYAWYEENAKSHPYPIGKKLANSFGVHDILGNVREWMQDDYVKYDNYLYADKSSNAHAVILDSTQKIVRGGSWYSSYEDMRVYKRDLAEIDLRDKATGFRVVLEK